MENLKYNKRRLLALIGTGAISATMVGCSTISAFDTLTPKDKNAHQIAKDIAYGDNPRQKYDVYAPKTITTNLPVIVFFYGGSWSSGKKDDYSWAGVAFASLGYIAVLADYRLVPEIVYPEFVNDCAAAVKHVKANIGQYQGDGQRIALIGHSAGAYNAAMLALDPHFLGADYSTIKAFVGIAGPYDFYPFDAKETIDAFSASADPKATQPVNIVKKSELKTLLLHSRADETVYLRNSTALEAKLRAADNYVKLVVYEKLSHAEIIAAISIPFREKAPILADIETFLNSINFK